MCCVIELTSGSEFWYVRCRCCDPVWRPTDRYTNWVPGRLTLERRFVILWNWILRTDAQLMCGKWIQIIPLLNGDIAGMAVLMLGLQSMFWSFLLSVVVGGWCWYSVVIHFDFARVVTQCGESWDLNIPLLLVIDRWSLLRSFIIGCRYWFDWHNSNGSMIKVVRKYNPGLS